MVIQSIPNTGNSSGLFVDESSPGLDDGTYLEALHLNVNTVQELANAVVGAGLTPDNTGADNTQLREAIKELANLQGIFKLMSTSTCTTSQATTSSALVDTNFLVADVETGVPAGEYDYFLFYKLYCSLSASGAQGSVTTGRAVIEFTGTGITTEQNVLASVQAEGDNRSPMISGFVPFLNVTRNVANPNILLRLKIDVEATQTFSILPTNSRLTLFRRKTIAPLSTFSNGLLV